jgi:hypothetical protein
MKSKDRQQTQSEKSYEFTRRESNVVHAVQSNAANLKSSSAQQHIVNGFQRRVLLMQTSRIHIERVTDVSRKEVLNTYACAELNVHLNSFYVHLHGGLDNLAWAMHYEYHLLGPKDEWDRNTRHRCGLFTNPFLASLEASHQELASFLRTKRSWFGSFRELRDPVAHRIPLYAMPGVIREGSQDAERVTRLNRESSEAFKQGDFEGGRDKLFEAWTIGEYEPWFTQYGSDSYTVRNIHGQIGADLDEFLGISEHVLHRLFSLPVLKPLF